MACRIVQTQPPNNEGERKMFAFLKQLPADYTLYSELQINTAFHRQVEGLRKKTPDFVVTGEDVGVLSLEVKHWNLDRYIYEWANQYDLKKLDARTGRVVADDIDAPHAQVNAYQFGLKNLVKHSLHDSIAGDLWVTSVLVFPLLTRTAFLDGVQNTSLLTGPQAKFYSQLDRVLFKEDLDRHVDQPEQLLREVVRRDSRFSKAGGKAIYKVNELLVPPKCRVGGDKKLQDNRKRMEVLSEQQTRWAFSLNPNQNYLLDVAGSGKTNALISKAIHLVDKATGEPPEILITTYNRNLEKSLRRIYKDKVGDEASTKHSSIKIWSIPALLEVVVNHGFGQVGLAEVQESTPDEEAYVRRLLHEAKSIIRDDPTRFARFDHIFIDEVQDFSNAFLRIVKYFAQGKSYFFVGDIGQKIYPRSYDLERLGLALNRKEMDKSYLMYRTPRYIAELATRFILGDSAMREEFAAHGYDHSFSYPNTLGHGAELHRTNEPEHDAADRIRELLETVYPGGEHQVLVVSSPERLEVVQAALEDEGVECQIGETEAGEAVTIVDFRDAKGLEREVVVVVGVEDLYHSSSSEATFDDATEQLEKEGLARRQVYVALTRPIERLFVYYSDRSHPYVKELCELNDYIGNKREEG